MFESGQLPDLHKPEKKTPTDEPAPESGVYENKPIELEGVVKSSDINMEGEQLQKGMTKNLLDEWKKKGEEPPATNKEPQVINVAEDEGRIIENEPEMRTDVVRECDIHPSDEIVIEKGHAKSLKERLLSQQEKPREKKVIKLVENEEAPTVFENTPVQLEGVVRANDDTDDTRFEKGKTKNLATYFLTKTDEVEVKKQPIKIERDSGPAVLENQPAVLEGVVRASDPLEDEANIKLSQGHAKNVASLWQKRNDEEDVPKAPKQPIKIDIADIGPTVVENEPVELEGVVKCDTVVEDIIPGNRGRTKDIADMFLKQGDDGSKSKPKKPIEIERADGPVVLENEPAPVPEGVVRSDSYTEDIALQKGHTKSLLQQWSTKQQESSSPKPSGEKPVWLKEIEAAKDSGVFENEPEQKTDVVRESDVPECEKSQCIPENYTANLKSMWMKKAEEEERIKRNDRVPELVRFTPPRELTPPPVKQQEYQSIQSITLTSHVNGYASQAQQSHTESTRTKNTVVNDSDPAPYTSPPPTQTVKTSTVLILK